MVKRLVVFGLLLTSAAAARADIVVALDLAASSGVNWVYDVSLDPGTNMKTNDFFTVFDFKGLKGANWVPDTTNALGRSFQTAIQATGPTPQTTVPTDLGSINNATVKMTGGAEITPSGEVLPIGKLTLTGAVGLDQTEMINFASQATGRLSQQSEFFISSVAGPSAVPEPSSLMFLSLGILGGLVYKLQRRRLS